MKFFLYFPLTIFNIFIVSGCATSEYFADRSRDTADIITFTVGESYGIKARVSSIHSGIYYGEDNISFPLTAPGRVP